MSEWKECKLEDIAEVIDSLHQTPKYSEFGYPMVRVTDIKKGYLDLSKTLKIDKEIFDKFSKNHIPKKGDIVFSRVGSYGNAAIVKTDEKFCLGQNTAFIIPKQNSFFIFYYLNSPIGFAEIESSVAGSTQPTVSLKSIRNFRILLPPLSEQRAIASVLSSLDDKIDLLHRQNKTLEAMAETLFRQWFVEEGREDWEEGTLGDVAINVRDSVKTENIQAETRYVGLEHIDRRNIALQQYGFGGDVSSNKYSFKKHDILFGKLRPYFHKVCFSPFSGICSTDILVIRSKKPEYFSFCLFAFFQNDVVEYANIGSGGTRMPRTDWETLKMYSIIIPDIKMTSQFNDFVLLSIKKITHNLDTIRTLEKLRDTLLPKLMSGEVRVKL